VRDSFEEMVLPKGALLVQEGRSCRHLYFLQEGALRGYYLLDGREVTHWFGFGPEFVTSFHSFTTGQAAVENIQLLEGSVLWSISKETLGGLLDRFHELERLVRLAYEHYYIRLEERFVNGQFRTAAERYAQLLSQEPHVLERVPLQYIASWLGISPETLSRVRASLNKP
jgi:CRP-like cAMP-binding protein